MTVAQKQQIMRLMSRYISFQCQVHEYEWERDLDGLKAYKEFITDLKDMHLNFNKLTEDDVKLLGFYDYTLKDGRVVWLAPLYLVDVIPDGTKMTGIMGKDFVKQGQLNNDNRNGYLAYGIIIK